MILPETELYELLQVQRRRLVGYMRTQKQYELDDVLQTALQVSTSTTGSLRASSEVVDAHNRWNTIGGSRSVGRFAVGSTRSGGTSGPGGMVRTMSAMNAPTDVADTGMLGVEMDLQASPVYS